MAECNAPTSPTARLPTLDKPLAMDVMLEEDTESDAEGYTLVHTPPSSTSSSSTPSPTLSNYPPQIGTLKHEDEPFSISYSFCFETRKALQDVGTDV